MPTSWAWFPAGPTPPPSHRRQLDAAGADEAAYGGLADPDGITEEALAHLSDGPTWTHGSENPTGGSPFGALSRRDSVLALSRGAAASP